MKTVDRETYDRVKATVPEHPSRVVELRRPVSLYLRPAGSVRLRLEPRRGP
jgi:hypothetical protein